MSARLRSDDTSGLHAQHSLCGPMRRKPTSKSSKSPYARKITKEDAIKAVTENWRILLNEESEYNAFKGDKDVIMAAIKQDGYALKLADEALRGDKDVVMAAVAKDGDI